MPGLKDATAVVGIGQTAFAKHLPESEKTLACRAILAALDDAGIAPAEVDALASYTMEETDEVEVAKAVGLGDLTFFSKVGYGGGGSCATVAHLAAAVTMRPGDGGRGLALAQAGQRAAPLEEHGRPAPHPGPVDPALRTAAARRRDRDARAPVHARVRGDPRPPLQRGAGLPQPGQPEPGRDDVRTPADPRDVHDRPLDQRAALPLRQLPGDGRRARLRDRVRRAGPRPRQRPVYVHSAAQGLPAQHHGMVNYWNDDPLTGPAWTAARHLWKHADLTPEDVDVAQIYDAFTPLIPLSLEGYGFCGRGEGGAFTEGGALEIGGRLPVNTGGGGLSEAYVHGFNLINEGVKQLRGTSTAQVPGAATCLVTAGEGVPTSALLLRS